MKRWKGKQLKDGLKMGLYHGMYCLGCCGPYFLFMIALGWMNEHIIDGNVCSDYICGEGLV
jgi:predicted metal-binding membrane protein